MEEIMRAGSGVGRQLSVCAVKKLLVSLLILALTGNSAFREMVDEFLRAPVIPVAETGDPVFADSKTEEAVLKTDKTVMADKEKLTLKNQISENEEGWKRLLTEFSVSEPTLRMPHMPEEPGDDLTESAVAEVITEPVIPRIAKADDITAENIPNESMSFENAIRLAVSIGGDSDTIAAITGGIAGAYYGVPENLREQALKYLSDDLTRSWIDFETVFS